MLGGVAAVIAVTVLLGLIAWAPRLAGHFNAWRAGAVLLVAVVAATGWMLRYDVNIASRGEAYPAAFVLDRWTGTMQLCSQARCVPVEQGAAR